MYLSELHGRLGQILREQGDMQVVRPRSLRLDGIVGTGYEQFVNYNSDDFHSCTYYVEEPSGERRIILKRFIIEIPF